MRELELAVHPLIDPDREPGGRDRVPFKLSRTAFVVSVGVHVLAGYVLSRQVWPDAPPQISIAEFLMFEAPQPRSPEPAPVPASPAEPLPAESPAPQAEIRERLAPQPQPVPSAAELPNEVVEPVEPPAVEVAPAPPSFIDFDEARQRAAREVVAEREADSEYLTFSIDDVAPPRPVAAPKPERSIFDEGGADFGGRSVAKVGQQRTRFGRKLVEICNALTGGFGVAFQGFGLFSACASPDGGPSGLFPEVRPEYLDLMPECVETRPFAEELGEESPFPTVKCRLVRQNEPEQ